MSKTKRMLVVKDKNGNSIEIPDNCKTKEMFVKQARKIWGNSYDYSESVYEGGKKPIIIYCPKHDYHFRVAMAQNHIYKPHGTFKPTGCPVCQYEKQHNVEYGPEWHNYLRMSPNSNRVGAIRPEYVPKTEESRERERKEREQRQKREQDNQEFMAKYHAKNLPEARFIEKMIAKYGDIYGREKLDYQGRDTPITLVCKEHGEFQITPRALLYGHGHSSGHGCYACCGLPNPYKKRNPSDGSDIKQIVKDYGKKMHHRYYVYAIDTKKKTVVVRCRFHGEIKHTFDWWRNGNGCEYCDGTRFWHGDFLKLARAKHGNKFKYRGLKNIKNSSSIIKIHCDNPEHHWWPQRVSTHIGQGCGCRECAGRHQTVEQRREKFLNDFHRKHGHNHYKVQADAYVNNDTPIPVRCLIHHYDYKTSPDNLLRGGGGCPYCTASEGEATILGWLDNHHISYEWQHEIPNNDETLPLQYLNADFFVPGMEGRWPDTIIEFNGEQHYWNMPHYYLNRKIRTFEVQQHRDQYLRDYCRDESLRLLEIPYWELPNIADILQRVFIDREPVPVFTAPI